MNNNFVSLIGYQLEKIHTGVIRWMLDSKNTNVSVETKYKILRRMFNMTKNPINFQIHEISAISCFPEYSFGRKRKIDLVVKIDLFQKPAKYIVIEMKVDSLPYSAQLEGTKNDFFESTHCQPEDATFILMLFGSSQVCEVPELHQFHLFRLFEIIEVFNGLPIEDVIYKQWIDSLFEEENRRIDILADLDAAPDIWNMEYWKDKGYRTPFPLFYYLYDHLKMKSKRSKEWEIYSGQNNPVMNWTNGALHKDILGHPVKFYWEFNYDEFVLKVRLNEDNKLPQDQLNWLREEIAKICFEEVQSGKRTKKTYGKFNSIYKWKFDFHKQPFEAIMKKVDRILDKIPPVLSSI
ncbi:PD-(D/E)XK nuclease family protein [Cytobacillus solani]|uniref:PD-(D/E)XK nuclease family protein n=1 Tax=Cytobacillus solani TaxID=1637975 RepID=UPI0006ABB3E0|nr:PD-(D/E)XK nuclease family protein [Cytobacillus solani]KOP81265.1 hypothetical protein AMS60_01355 [Bacillus sp. FJAT-21945]